MNVRSSHSCRWALAVLAARPPASIAADVRTVLRDLDPDVPLADVRPMGDVVADALAARRFLLIVTGSFAATALLLATIGAYGVLAWSVEQRSRELGIRLALGARASSILGLVVAQGLRLTAAGLAVGLAVALTGAGAMASLLYGVSPRDGVTYGVVAAAILIVAAGASLGPGVRAMRANPTRILRLE